jgi:hypothetical protein
MKRPAHQINHRMPRTLHHIHKIRSDSNHDSVHEVRHVPRDAERGVERATRPALLVDHSVLEQLLRQGQIALVRELKLVNGLAVVPEHDYLWRFPIS